MDVSKDEKYIGFGNGGSVKIIDVDNDYTELKSFSAHGPAVRSLSFSYDNTKLVTCTDDSKEIKMWDRTNDYAYLTTVSNRHNTRIEEVSFLRLDSTKFVSIGGTNNIFIWFINNSYSSLDVNPSGTGNLFRVKFSKDDSFMVTLDRSGYLSRFDV